MNIACNAAKGRIKDVDELRSRLLTALDELDQRVIDTAVSARREAVLLPARRYASAGLCDSDVSVRLSVRLSVCLSHAGIVPSRAKAGS